MNVGDSFLVDRNDTKWACNRNGKLDRQSISAPALIKVVYRQMRLVGTPYGEWPKSSKSRRAETDLTCTKGMYDRLPQNDGAVRL